MRVIVENNNGRLVLLYEYKKGCFREIKISEKVTRILMDVEKLEIESKVSEGN